MTFSDQLRAERERLGLDHKQAADILDVSKRAIAYWEEGRHPHVLTQEGALARLATTPTALALRKPTKTMSKETAMKAAAESLLKYGKAYKRLAENQMPAKKGRAKR